jgi:hypothetical protein
MYDWSLSWVSRDKQCMAGHFTGCLKTKVYDWSISWVSRDKICMTAHFPGCLDKNV